MRMWMVKPLLLCRKHLLGEHGEIHKFLPTFRKGYSIDGRMEPVVQIELSSLKKRHDALAREIDRRAHTPKQGHKSPLNNSDIPDLKALYPEHYDKKVDVYQSLFDLMDRCPDCYDRISRFMNGQELE